MGFQLSDDQVDAIEGIYDVLLDRTNTGHAIAVLTGSAGVGKTTVVSSIINYIRKSSVSAHIELCATTHRAAAVLGDITGCEVSTGHALFKLRPGVSKYGNETLTSAGVCEVPDRSIIVVDEASMLGNQFLSAIVDIVRKKALKILFVGDPYQLAPPKDQCSIFDGSLPTFTLTKVHRQLGGNPILDKAIEYRDFIAGTRKTEPILETMLNAAGEGIQVLPHADFVSSFVKKYVTYETGAVVDIPLCTYTNESAINYNSMIRKAAYFLEDTIAPFYPGERLIANSIVKNGDRTLLTNNETVTVKSFSTGEVSGIPGYNVRVEGDYNKYTKSRIKTVFCPATTAAADRILNELKKTAINGKSKALWIDYYELKNKLADLRPPFAGTTHKAQGGTFSAVFIDQVNINKCRDPITRARLLYVALTRASKNVYVNV